MINLSSAVSYFKLIAEGGTSCIAIWLPIVLVLTTVIGAALILGYEYRDKLPVIFDIESLANLQYFYGKNEGKDEVVAVEQLDAENTKVVQSETLPGERTLTGIKIDAESAQRIFVAGDAFDCSGLKVHALYNFDPMSVKLGDIKVVDNDTFTRLKRRSNVKGVFVIKPYMYIDGEKTVTVAYEDCTAEYTIYVKRRNENEDIEQFVDVSEPVDTDLSDVERSLTDILIDTDVVQKEFTAGDAFDYEGLVVLAKYSSSPTQVSLTEYNLVDQATYLQLESRSRAPGVYVVKPNMNVAGESIVTVAYEDKCAQYTIFIKSDVATEEDELETIIPTVTDPVIDMEESVEITREPLSITINTDNIAREYVVGDTFNSTGLVVTAHFNVEQLEENVADYTLSSPDMNTVGKQTVVVSYNDVTAQFEITVNPAPEKQAEIEVDSEEAPEEVIFVKQQQPPIIIEEETVDTRLRYDKSFMARLIQSEDEIKYWYTDLKNDILSYKGVKGRISWKRETFKCGGKLVLAKLSYRGKVLCLFLPLKPSDYEREYPVEVASDAYCYIDTPLMLRIKNPTRMEIARELIGIVMKKNKMVRVSREAIDYYVPYEGILDLINKGYARRNIRTAEEEAIFERDNDSVEDESDTLTLTKVAPGIYVTKKD